MSKSNLLKNKLLGNKVNHIDYGGNTSGTQSSGVGLGVQDVARNPKFVSQFDINVNIFYSYVDMRLDTGTSGYELLSIEDSDILTPESIPSQLKTDLPLFLFGNADSTGGYSNAKKQLQLSNWVYGQVFTVESSKQDIVIPAPSASGLTVPQSGTFVSPAVFQGKARIGDIIIPCYYESGARTYLAEIIVNCKQVSYSTLLAALSSDRFKINMVRYKIPNLEKTAQYEKNMQLLRQSFFGKITTDFLSPAAYQNPEQFQQGIVDIPMIKGMDKESIIMSYLNYDVDEILLSFYVESQDKLVQDI